MNRSEFVFAIIDVLFHIPQNYIRYKDIEVEKDIVYSDLDAEACKMDIYYKKGAKTPMPVIVNIHGGGFVKGDKKHRISVSHMYAERGWFVANINYRLSPKYAFPAAVEDVVNAVNYLTELKERFDLNLDKVVLTGDSAGAYLAAETEAVVTDRALRERLGIPECKVKPAGLALFCGPYDMLAAINAKLPFGLVKNIAESFMGFKLDKDLSNLKDYKYLKDIAPIDYVNSSWPPTVLTMAKKDVFCKGHGELMYQKLQEAGVKVSEHHSTKFLDNHCYHFNYWVKASKEAMAMVYGFLDGLYSYQKSEDSAPKKEETEARNDISEETAASNASEGTASETVTEEADKA